MKVLGTLLSLVLASGAQAQSLQEKYAPSVQCGKQATERFARDWNERSVGANFENYYNSRLNKCFYLEISALYGGAKRMLTLIDLHENRVIGSYDKLAGAHKAINLWRVATGRTFGACSWEIYGDWTDDEAKLETQVVYFLS